MTNYNKYPEIKIKGEDGNCFAGWDDVATELKKVLGTIPSERKVLAVECYMGVDDQEVLPMLVETIRPSLVFLSERVMYPFEHIKKLTDPDVTDDRIFGFITRLRMEDYFDPENMKKFRERFLSINHGIILVYGPGASIIVPDHNILVYADMPRWEIQMRLRKKKTHNLGVNNFFDSFETHYKRGYFVDWRVCDRLKKKLINHWNYMLDTTIPGNPRMITAGAFDEAMSQVASQPFSVVPYFDAGPWGGQWMKEKFGLDPKVQNFAWCFNCVPEENSLFLRFGNIRFETPAINLVFFQSQHLLGDAVHARFGDEFPIRFDFLDTMRGGNLSLQVHPLTEYIRENFGIHYTQDESYYLMDAEEGARVFLGLKEGVDRNELKEELMNAQEKGIHFDDSRFIGNWPAKKHDHFLIPGGTVHCSGKNSMVLEISSTPYIFTFKLWDWGRLGLDGKPRPINIGHGLANIQWNRTESWVRENLIDQIEVLEEGNGWREEHTGLHKREFIETRRHWFTSTVHHHTQDGVNVLALVEGDEVVVESPGGAFDPFVVHYAEVFIVPAAVGAYTIRPTGRSEGKECATIKAYVRVNA